MATSNPKQPKKVSGANPYGATKSSDVDMTVGYVDKESSNGATKTSGIKIRGTGAATKGTMARGPMA